MSPVTIRDADPERDAAACAAIYAPERRGERRSPSRSGRPTAAEFARPDRAVSPPPTPGWSPSAGERWSATPTPVRTASGPPTAGPSTSPSTSTPASVARVVGRALYAELFERLRAPGLPDRLRRHHPAEPGQHRPAREPRLRADRRHSRDIGWKEGAWRDVGWWQLELAPPGDGRPPPSRCRPSPPPPTRVPLSHA